MHKRKFHLTTVNCREQEIQEILTIIAYDSNTEIGKINDDSVVLYASDNFLSNKENPESCLSGEEQTSSSGK